MNTEPKWTDSLPKDTCDEAVRWALRFPTAQEAWDACERGDWMFWLLEKLLTLPNRKIELARCECVRPCLRFIADGEDRPRLAVEEAEAWANWEHDDYKRVIAARAAAGDAAWDAAWDAARDAAWDAARAAQSIIIRKHFPKAPL